MKPFPLRAASALLAVLCISPLSALAATEVAPLYPDYDPPGEDSLTVSIPAGIPLSVQIVQHSEERENLVLFRNDFAADEKKAQELVYALEPGSYTVTAGTPLTADGYAQQDYSFDITVENADFKERYDRTALTLSVEAHDAAENAAVTGAGKPQVADGVRHVDFTCSLPRSEKKLGDMNGDGKVDMKDAMQALTVAETEQMLFETADITDEQRLLADTDCDGEVTMRDAMRILVYWDDMNMGYEPEWNIPNT